MRYTHGDGAESGWGDDAVDNVLTLIDKFFLGEESK